MTGDLPSRLSSDEGEVDISEESEKLDCHYSGHHPRPLGVCLFLPFFLVTMDIFMTSCTCLCGREGILLPQA